MTTPSRRIERVNSIIREELAELIRRDLKDPRVSGIVSITRVQTTADLSRAKVYVSVLGAEGEAEKTLAALKHASSFFYRELRDRLKLKRTPDLTFLADDSLAHGDRVLRLMREE